MSLSPAGTVLELGPPPHTPNAPNIKHTLIDPVNLLENFKGRPIISIGQASPAAEAASLVGAAETARMAAAGLPDAAADEFVWKAVVRRACSLYNLEARQAGEMQRRMQYQHGCTVFMGCKEGEHDFCYFENPDTWDVRAFKRPFIPVGAENPFLVASRDVMTASHAQDIARSRILHQGVLQRHHPMSRAMFCAVSENPNLAARSGLASMLAHRLTSEMRAKEKLYQTILKQPSPFSKKGGKKRTGRARLRSCLRSRRRG
jgi:hypothetical protein